MGGHDLKTAVLVLSVAVGVLLVVPALVFPEASCLSRGPHHTVCEIGRVPTLVVLLLVVVALPITTWVVDPE
ncbi:hypothetical protein [Halorussus halobius]|uniref:hypothetical protein n=1 Tax=Halorussus halobius TaxID=1710537 RepID=UPI0010927F7E|nr:hypothetical protein [Halorussus halobius]